MKKNEAMKGRLLRGKGKVGKDPTTQFTLNEMKDANFLGRVIGFWNNSNPRSKPSFSFVAFVIEILSKESDIVVSNCLEFILPSSVNRFYPEIMVFLDDFDRPTVIAYGYLSSYSSAAFVCSVLRPYTSKLIPDVLFMQWWVTDKSSPSMRIGVEEHIFCSDGIFKFPGYRITINPNLKQANILITIPELYVLLYSQGTQRCIKELSGRFTHPPRLGVLPTMRDRYATGLSSKLIRESTRLKKKRIEESWKVGG